MVAFHNFLLLFIIIIIVASLFSVLSVPHSSRGVSKWRCMWWHLPWLQVNGNRFLHFIHHSRFHTVDNVTAFNQKPTEY